MIFRAAGQFGRTVRDAITVIVFACLVSAIIGQIFNDRIKALIPLMYFPVPVLAIVAITIDAIRVGRTFRGVRFIFSIIAILSLAIESPRLFGFGSFADRDPALPTVRVLQWNVMWGGSFSTARDWDDIAKKVIDRKPDLAILSESPMFDQKLEDLRLKLGESWHMSPADYFAGSSGYMSRIRLFSRYPIAENYIRHCPDGMLAVFTVSAPTPFRVMVADGVSGLNDKTRLLNFISETMKSDGHVDLIAGDFNATSRSSGFGGIREQGYHDADDAGFTYRATWPAFLPIYDIDHVFVASRHRVLNCRSFRSGGSDHRGQYVDLQFMR